MDEKKQSDSGIPQYRCQRCGDVNMNIEAPCAPFKILAVLAANPLAAECNGVNRSALHNCDDGGLGISVIVGMFPEHHVAPLRERLKKEAEEAAARRGSLSKSVN